VSQKTATPETLHIPMKRLHLILAGLALAAITTPAQAIQIPVTGDTTATASTGSAVPNRILKTAGTSTSLPVGPKSTPVLFFNLANSGINPSAITKARLVIYFSNVTRAGTFKTLFPTTAFQELFTPTSVPFTAPTGVSPDEPVTTANRRGYVISYGYEEIVKGWINNPSSNGGIAIVGDALLSATISSREGAATGAAAFLEIDVNPTAGAVGATTLATTGDTTIGGKLGVTGTTRFEDFVTIANNKALTISGTGSLGVGGNINCSNDISAFRDLHGERNLSVGGTSTLAGNVTIGGSTSRFALNTTTTSGAASRIRAVTGETIAQQYETPSGTKFAQFNDPVASGASLFLFAGAGAQPGGGSWANSSDRRLKKNIEPLSGALDRLLQLRSVTYEYIDPAAIHEPTGTQIGFIAQEVEPLFPNWVGEKADGMKFVSVKGFESLTVQALRELRAEKDAEIAALKEKIAALEARAVARVTLDAELEARLVRLEAASGADAPVKVVTTAFTGKQ
jgi:hypothetical protein